MKYRLTATPHLPKRKLCDLWPLAMIMRVIVMSEPLFQLPLMKAGVASEPQSFTLTPSVTQNHDQKQMSRTLRQKDPGLLRYKVCSTRSS